MDAQTQSPPPLPRNNGSCDPTTKGFGLKKWKRIPRDFTKEGTPIFDSAKVLKRGFSGPPIPNPNPNPNPIPNLSKNKAKAVGGKGFATNPGQRGKLQVENPKKLRGERLKLEKESSSGITSNGRRAPNSDGRSSDEQPEAENLSQPHSPHNLSSEEKSDTSPPHPLLHSILSLQSAQEALQNEVVKLGEMGRESVSLYDNSIKDGSVPAELNSYINQEIREPSTSGQLETQLKENVNHLERKLEEARTILAEKESRVVELEAALNSGKQSKEEESGRKCRKGEVEVEVEMEGIFRQKIEAEVVYLTITQTIQKPRMDAGDNMMLVEDQKLPAKEKAHMLNQLGGNAESIAAAMLKKPDEKLDYYEVITEAEELLKAQSGVCRFSIYFVTQFILLVVLVVFAMQQWSSPDFEDAVPT